MNCTRRLFALVLLIFSLATFSRPSWTQTTEGPDPASTVAVGAQYDTTHVYVSPSDVDAFVAGFLGTFGGKSTKQVVGTVSLFGFLTPIPAPFGAERTGYLVTNMDTAIKKAKASGADVVVTPFPDPIGVDAVIEFPGGVKTQIYWHTTAPSYTPFVTVPENRVYVSPDAVNKFLHSFLAFSDGRVVFDQPAASGNEIGMPGTTFRRVQVESVFGKLLVLVTDGHLPYPYGRETTGYEVDDLGSTLQKATSLGVKVLIQPVTLQGRTSAMVQFPGGYIAEIHSPISSAGH
jgi:hypothetical protein